MIALKLVLDWSSYSHKLFVWISGYEHHVASAPSSTFPTGLLYIPPCPCRGSRFGMERLRPARVSGVGSVDPFLCPARRQSLRFDISVCFVQREMDRKILGSLRRSIGEVYFTAWCSGSVLIYGNGGRMVRQSRQTPWPSDCFSGWGSSGRSGCLRESEDVAQATEALCKIRSPLRLPCSDDIQRRQARKSQETHKNRRRRLCCLSRFFEEKGPAQQIKE